MPEEHIDWSSIDPLGQALHFLRMDGTFYCHSQLSAPWGFEMPEIPQSLMFHVLLEGTALIMVADEPVIELTAGDLVLVPHGRGHTLVDAVGSDAPNILDVEREHVSQRYERLEHGGGGTETRMVCGAVHFDHPAAAELINLLPRVIRVRHWPKSERRWVESTIALMTHEAESQRPGGETVMTRLADILVIQAIRAWLSDASEARTGWLGALQDPQIGRAIVAVHRAPGADCSVEALAAQAGMSRSGFAQRFAELMGETPARYVLRWRMQIASSWLRDEPRTSIAEIADRLGYTSQASFSRAFKRWKGVPPMRVRRTTEATAPAA